MCSLRRHTPCAAAGVCEPAMIACKQREGEDMATFTVTTLNDELKAGATLE